MKKRLFALLMGVVLVAGVLAGCGSKAKKTESVTKENIKVGFVHFSDPSDQGYTYNHDSATWKMVEELGLNKSQIINKYNVPENAECGTAMRELAEEGCKVIFATAHGHEDYMIEVAAEYPDITFCHFNGTQAESSGLSNMHNYFGEICQIRYLSGIVAGLTTKTNKIGYVAAMDYAEVNNGLDAYYLGAKSVNPNVEVYATYLNVWFDAALESQATQSLIDRGCDVVSHHADSTAGSTTCEANGAFFIPYNSDMSSIAPKSVLTSVRWDTSSYLKMVINNVLDGKANEIPVDFTGTIENGMIYLDDVKYDLLDEATAKEVEAKLTEAKEKFIKNELEVFVGPLKDQNGKVVLEEGKTFVEPKSAPSFGYVLEGINVIK